LTPLRLHSTLSPAAMRRLRWFGSGWGHPDLLMGNHVPTPAGKECIECGKAIEVDDDGLVVIRSTDQDVEAHIALHPAHRECSALALPDEWQS
jgi:hypothetical protein